MDPSPRLTDLQYAVYECGLTVEAAANRLGSTTAKILAELAATPLPPWIAEQRHAPRVMT